MWIWGLHLSTKGPQRQIKGECPRAVQLRLHCFCGGGPLLCFSVQVCSLNLGEHAYVQSRQNPLAVEGSGPVPTLTAPLSAAGFPKTLSGVNEGGRYDLNLSSAARAPAVLLFPLSNPEPGVQAPGPRRCYVLLCVPEPQRTAAHLPKTLLQL